MTVLAQRLAAAEDELDHGAAGALAGALKRALRAESGEALEKAHADISHVRP